MIAKQSNSGTRLGHGKAPGRWKGKWLVVWRSCQIKILVNNGIALGIDEKRLVRLHGPSNPPPPIRRRNPNKSAEQIGGPIFQQNRFPVPWILV